MNPDIGRLHPYPFERLHALKAGIRAPDLPHIALSIGEPRHQPPAFVQQQLTQHMRHLASYPLTRGQSALRESIARWLIQRFALGENGIDPETQVVPVNGTREALFAFAQAVVDRGNNAKVLMPNPFYQIYEGAALLAGAQPVYLNTTKANGFVPDFEQVSETTWRQCQLLYLCSPGNPTGAVLDEQTLLEMIERAHRYDFVIAADECYSEIYMDEDNPPLGLLQVAAKHGIHDYKHCVAFHSLSKRSNVPGLRSGFVAGDADILRQFLKYRTYHGCAMPDFIQLTSAAIWADEQHVVQNRQRYREKFAAVAAILNPVLPLEIPPAAFYLWPETPMDDENFSRGLFQSQNVTVLPGSYLSRQAEGINPGANRIRIALVAELAECEDAAQRIRTYIQSL